MTQTGWMSDYHKTEDRKRNPSDNISGGILDYRELSNSNENN